MAYESASPMLASNVLASLDPSAPTTQVDMAQVTIQRDAMTSIPTDVRAYEVDILREMYGEDRIEVVKTFTMEVPDASVDEEYARLEAKYKLSRTPALRQVYPTKKSLADAMGVAYRPQRGSQRQSALPGSLVVENYDPRISGVSGGDEVSGIEAEIKKAQAEADAKIAALKTRLGVAKEDAKVAKTEAKADTAKDTVIDAARATPVVVVSKAEVKAAKGPAKATKSTKVAKKGK